jgi:hypothetical protein
VQLGAFSEDQSENTDDDEEPNQEDNANGAAKEFQHVGSL